MASRESVLPDGYISLAKKYFARAVDNRRQRKMEIIEHNLPALLEEIERAVEAGYLMLPKRLDAITAEVLRMPEFGFTVTLKGRDKDGLAYYIISWCPSGAKERRMDAERIACMTFPENVSVNMEDKDAE